MADGSLRTHRTPDLRPAFAALYRQHAGLVRRALRQLGVPPASLDDAVQDVFVVLHRRIDDYERDRSLTNWLWGIARGVASGYRRGQRRRDRLHAVLPAPEGAALPEGGVARREAADILDQFLSSLDADKCAVFVLSELEGRRGPEIAEQLQVNLNTVYARLRAARQRFDDAMADHRAPARRPMFAAWLSWAWPAWLGKPAAVVGAAAVAAVVVTGASAPAPRPAAHDEVVVAVAEPMGEAPSRASTSARASRGSWSMAADEREDEIVLDDDDDDDDEVLLLEDEPARARARMAAAQPAPASALEPTAQLEPEPLALAEEPSRVPWSSAVEARRPVRHPSLVELRADFVAELLRVASRL